MKERRTNDPDHAANYSAPPLRRQVPAWAMSIVLHAALLVLLALFLRQKNRGQEVEADRPVGLAMVEMVDGQRTYFPVDGSDPDLALQSGSSNTSLSEALPETSDIPFDLTGALPSSAGDILGDSDLTQLPSASEMGTNTGSSSGPAGDKAETSIFGLKGEGTKFLYVFDRSSSMDGYGGRPLLAAKRALSASLDDLGDTHRFQIIFYNEAPQPFIAAGDIPRLYYGDERGTSMAKRFIERMTASGATRHMPALEMALRLRPDVLFFLTDADEPQLSPEDLRRIDRLNQRQTIIHAIEFGYGLSSGRSNFLHQLAQQNGGEHTYIDVSRLPR